MRSHLGHQQQLDGNEARLLLRVPVGGGRTNPQPDGRLLLGALRVEPSDCAVDMGDPLAGPVARRYCTENLELTVMVTGTGTPLTRVAVNLHRRTASKAA